MLPRFTARFTRTSGMVAGLTVAVGGSWTLSGSYPPLVDSPTGGDQTCGPQVPVSCAGPVVSHTRGHEAKLDIGVSGRRALGFFNLFPEVVESATYAAPDPGKPFCSASGSEPTRVVPLFGLGSTSLANRAVPSPLSFPLRFPVAKLAGRRAFTVTLPPARLQGCATPYYTPCSESGRVVMRLSFTPARR
jgi:hypothetical protein